MLHESDGTRIRRRRETGNQDAPRLPGTLARLVTFTVTAATRSSRSKTTQIRVLTTSWTTRPIPPARSRPCTPKDGRWRAVGQPR
jgi:hypothetical protein